jgi:acyl carrier protein
MWSIKDLPDEIYECDQIYDIENEFSIALTEDEALTMYDMSFEEAVNFLEEKTTF